MTECAVHLRNLKHHPKQRAFVKSEAKRKVVRAGRRGGKTTGAATLAVRAFLGGRRVLYAVPTQEQVDRFWFECKRALAEPLDIGLFYKNETRHIIERPSTEQRIRGKTAWNADTLRGDFADLLILDEYQLMGEGAWDRVGAPMLLDNNGDAVFIYTTTRGLHHSKKLYKQAKADETGRWASFEFSSFDNPYISREALDEITGDMTALAYRMEILALEIDDDPRALWNREDIEGSRVTQHPPLARIVVGIDPPGKATGAECGIVVAGIDAAGHGYVIEDRSLQASPATWGSAVVTAYNHNKADRVVAEVNFGGEMVENTLRTVQGGARLSYKPVHASRGKMIRAEPIAALYEQGKVHHVGQFSELEDQQCTWVQGEGPSPDRVDALVWVLTELMLERQYKKPGTVRYV